MPTDSRTASLAALLALSLAACSGGGTSNPSGPSVPTPSATPPPTSAESIAHPLPTAPATGAPVSGCCLGTAAVDVLYHISSEPVSGFDALKFTMSPERAQMPNAYYFWAFEDYMTGNPDGSDTFYFGLQPEGQYGLTAVFSFFGSNTSSTDSACAQGADSGPGTSCHIPYPWTYGHFYDFTVTLEATTSTTETWLGTVTDDNTQVTTKIGDVTVPTSWGYLGQGAAFDEYFGYQTYPCAQQPLSEILYLRPTGYLRDTSYPGALKTNGLVTNGGCNVVFYSDLSTYAYVVSGQATVGH